MKKVMEEIRAKTVKELAREINKLREEISKLRLKGRGEEKDTNILGKKRKELARLLTVFGEKKERSKKVN